MGMAAIMINEPWQFHQIFNSYLAQGSTWSFKKIDPGVKEKYKILKFGDNKKKKKKKKIIIIIIIKSKIK